MVNGLWPWLYPLHLLFPNYPFHHAAGAQWWLAGQETHLGFSDDRLDKWPLRRSVALPQCPSEDSEQLAGPRAHVFSVFSTCSFDILLTGREIFIGEVIWTPASLTDFCSLCDQCSTEQLTYPMRRKQVLLADSTSRSSQSPLDSSYQDTPVWACVALFHCSCGLTGPLWRPHLKSYRLWVHWIEMKSGGWGLQYEISALKERPTRESPRLPPLPSCHLCYILRTHTGEDGLLKPGQRSSPESDCAVTLTLDF